MVYRGRPLSFYVGKLKSGKERDRVYGIRAIGYFGADGAPAVARTDGCTIGYVCGRSRSGGGIAGTDRVGGMRWW